MINNRKLKNWLEDGLKKGYDFYYLRDSLIDRGLKKEAEKLKDIFQKINKEAKSEKENNNSNNNSQKTRKINSILLLSIFSLIVVLFFVMNNSQFPWGGYIIYESENPGAIVNINFQDEVGVVRDDFYGIDAGDGFWVSDNPQYKIAINGDNYFNGKSNSTWHKQQLQNLRIKKIRYRSPLYESTWDGTLNKPVFNVSYSNSEGVWFNIDSFREVVDFAKETDTIAYFVMESVPIWLQNTSSGYCDFTSNSTCPPNNYTKYENLVYEFLDQIDCDAEHCEIECQNEPEQPSYYLSNISPTNPIRAIEYIKLCNATYNAVQKFNSSMKTYGPTTHVFDIESQLILKAFMSNFSGVEDMYLSFHYISSDYTADQIYANLTALCTSNNFDCSIMSSSEWKHKTAIEQNATSLQYKWGENVALNMLISLNSYPENISQIYYKWQDREIYNINGSEYPLVASMVSEPQLDNAYYPPYNITKNFATYHSSGSTIVKSNSSSDNIKVVASKKGDSQYITVINTGEEVNVGLNLFGSEISQIKDLESGEVYDVEDNEVYIGTMDQYQIRYFVNSEGEESELLSYTPPLGNEEEEEDENSTLENESEEQCNNVSLNNQTCESLGYSSGVLSYNSQCELDTSNCINNSQSEENTHDNLNEEDTLSETNELDKNNNNGVKDKQKAFSFTNILYFSLVIGIFLLIFCVTKVLIKVKKYGTLKSHY